MPDGFLASATRKRPTGAGFSRGILAASEPIQPVHPKPTGERGLLGGARWAPLAIKAASQLRISAIVDSDFSVNVDGVSA